MPRVPSLPQKQKERGNATDRKNPGFRLVNQSSCWVKLNGILTDCRLVVSGGMSAYVGVERLNPNGKKLFLIFSSK